MTTDGEGPDIGGALAEHRGESPEDPGGPYLFVDLYAQDLGMHPPWTILATTPHYFGAIIKATEGTHYAPSWFRDNWQAIRRTANGRYGTTWFRGAYHFLRLLEPGRAQADYYLDAIEHAGGWDRGDIIPIVDVELGGERNPNRRASMQQIIDCAVAWSRRVKERTGRRVMLYGRGAMRDLAIKSKMGCDVVWNPSYTARMVTNGLVPPWSLDDIALWQFGGDGVGNASVHHLPLKVPGFGAVDVSVYVDGPRKPTLESLKRRIVC